MSKIFEKYNTISTHLEVRLRELGLSKKEKYLKRLGVEDNVPNDTDSQFYVKATDDTEARSIMEDKDLFNKYCFYIKLHGSQDFKDENNDQILIAGKDKGTTILNNNLIKYYHDLFSKKTGAPCNLIIVGYGFQDLHINEKIIICLRLPGSKLYVIENKNVKDLLETLSTDKELAILIKKRLVYYSSHGLTIGVLRDLASNF